MCTDDNDGLDVGAAESRRAAAARRILDAPPMEVPDVADLARELDDVRGRRDAADGPDR